MRQHKQLRNVLAEYVRVPFVQQRVLPGERDVVLAVQRHRRQLRDVQPERCAVLHVRRRVLPSLQHAVRAV